MLARSAAGARLDTCGAGGGVDIDEVQRRARSGPRALFARRAFAICIGIASTVTIPHLVPPREYGLAAMSIVVFSLADMFRDLGSDLRLVAQRRDPSG